LRVCCVRGDGDIGHLLITYEHNERARVRSTHLAPKPRISVVLFCLLVKEARTKQGECEALVVKVLVKNSRHRLRMFPTVPLVVRRRYFIVAPRPFPAAPLVVRRKCLIAVPRPLPAAPRRQLIVVPRPLPAAPLALRRRCLVVVPRPLPAAQVVVRRM
jgi:hypothetical protein